MDEKSLRDHWDISLLLYDYPVNRGSFFHFLKQTRGKWKINYCFQEESDVIPLLDGYYFVPSIHWLRQCVLGQQTCSTVVRNLYTRDIPAVAVFSFIRQNVV